ncbi:hypothetical protein ACSS31_28640 (plasmid) [Priestia megaterium]
MLKVETMKNKVSEKINYAVKALKNTRNSIKKTLVLGTGATILTYPTFTDAATWQIVKDFNKAITDFTGALYIVIPSLTILWVAWHAISGLNGDHHKKAEIKEKITSGLIMGAVGITANTLVTLYYSYFH